jgi:folate-binding protein YgfZ
MTRLVRLPARSVLRLTGADRVSFLNGLVSNDVSLAAPGQAVWAALLTPQGKYLADFFILAEADSAQEGALLLDCDTAQAGVLAQKLMRFRLRADVAITATDLLVYAAWDGPAPDAVIAAPDSRLPEAGWRVLSTAALPETAAFDDWDQHRLRLGLPDGPRDLETEKSVLLEAGFDELGGICWTKGCYMGQELTARTRYRGLLKRRLFPVQGAALPPHGTPILSGEREIGEMRSSNGTVGLALLRIDSVSGSLDGVRVAVPEWMRLPGHEEQQAAG